MMVSGNPKIRKTGLTKRLSNAKTTAKMSAEANPSN